MAAHMLKVVVYLKANAIHGPCFAHLLSITNTQEKTNDYKTICRKAMELIRASHRLY